MDNESQNFTPVLFTCSIPSYLIGKHQFKSGVYRAQTAKDADEVRKLSKMIPMPRVQEVNRAAAEEAAAKALLTNGSKVSTGAADSSQIGANGITETGTEELGSGQNPPGDTGVKAPAGLQLGGAKRS